MPDAVAPDGSEIFFRVLDAARASLVEVVLPPGETSRPVRHQTVEEISYFLAGAGDVCVDPAIRRVSPGDVIVIPTGVAFQFRSVGEEPLRFLCYTTPRWPGEHEAAPVDAGGLGPPTV